MLVVFNTSILILLTHCLVTHPSASDSFATLVLGKFIYLLTYLPGLEFSRLESWSRDVSRLNFESLGLGLGLDA